jgi:hypothetical protein
LFRLGLVWSVWFGYRFGYTTWILILDTRLGIVYYIGFHAPRMALVKRACLVLVLFCACAITSSWFPALELLRSFVNASSLPSSFASQSSVFRSAVDDSSGLSGWFTLVEERCARLIDVEEGSRCVSRGRTWATAEPVVVSHVVGGGRARATDELEGFQRECLCSLGTTCLPAGAVDPCGPGRHRAAPPTR